MEGKGDPSEASAHARFLGCLRTVTQPPLRQGDDHQRQHPSGDREVEVAEVTLSMPSPPAGPVPARAIFRTSCDSSCAMTCVMKPPRENPRRSTCSKPSARIKATASRAGGAGYSLADWWMPTAFSALLLREELESLLDELLVELEDSAVAGVRVDHQLVVRQTSGHVEGVRRRQHPVVIAVREEHGLADE